MKNSPGQPVPIDTDQWSEESRRSLDYLNPGAFYKDRPFTCRVCGESSVFTAEQQKYTYEIKKASTSQFHVLCHGCFLARQELAAEASVFLAHWLEKKPELAGNAGALRRWREILELLPRYNVPKDTARIHMIERLLRGVA